MNGAPVLGERSRKRAGRRKGWIETIDGVGVVVGGLRFGKRSQELRQMSRWMWHGSWRVVERSLKM